MGVFGIDGGHALVGAIGARGNGLKEEVMDRKVRDRLIAMLREHKHTVIDISVDNCSNASNQLNAICDKANAQKLDLSVHLHLNAFSDPKANGVETFSYTTGDAAHKYSKNVQAALVKDIGWTNRGCKTANFRVLKGTKAPAILIEMGFITNKADMDKFNVEKISAAIFRGITGKSYAPIKPVTPPPTSSKTMYRVYSGSFTSKKNAEDRMSAVKKAGFDSFMEYFEPKKSWRVVVGSFSSKANAEARVKLLKGKGFDSFIAVK